MREAALVVGEGGEVLHRHSPAGRTTVSLPDSRDLWAVLWEHRARIVGVAHTHPGVGTPRPSWEDLTTFAAVEDGLGRRLIWWIASADGLAAFGWSGPDRYVYGPVDPGEAGWLVELRALSGFVRAGQGGVW